MSLPLEPVLARLDANREPAIERWKELLRIPSIGTDPARNADTRRAAEWLVEQPPLDRLRGVAARDRGPADGGRRIIRGRTARAARTSSTTGTTTCSRSSRSSSG